MLGIVIRKIKYFSWLLQRTDEEHFVVNRLTAIRLKDPYYSNVDPGTLPPIMFENGKLNKEGQRILANALAEYLRKKTASKEGSTVSFGVYLEKAMKVVEKLGMEEYKKLGLLSGSVGESCFIPENYWSAAITVVD